MLFLAQASAISVKPEKAEFFLGEKMLFSGECSGSLVKVSVAVEEKKVLEKQAPCTGGIYSLQIETRQSDPTGNWKFVFSDSESKSVFNAFMLPREERELLALRLIVPESAEVHRNASLELTVQVLFDNTPFDTANVFYWNTAGEKITMSPAGEGIFKSGFSIPVDFNPVSWNLFVVAVSSDANPQWRGQLKKTLAVLPAEMVISVVEPKFTTLEAGIGQAFLIEAVYADGTPLKGGSVFFSFNSENLEMQKGSGNSFFLQKFFEEKDLGAQKIVFIAKDSFGNSASKEFSFFVEGGFWLGFGSQLFLVPVAAALFAAIALAWLFAKKIRSKSALEKKIVSRRRQIKEIQQRYFVERSVSEDYYRKRLGRLSAELSAAEKKLNKAKNNS